MLRQRCSPRLTRSTRLASVLASHAPKCRPTLDALSPRARAWRSVPSSINVRCYSTSEPSYDDTLRRLALSHHLPSKTGDRSEQYNESLRAHLVVSLLPVNQQCILGPSSKGQPISPQLRMARAMGAPEEEVEAGPSATMDEINGLGEPVIGVVSPIEGGDCYNREAVLQVAQKLNAEVLRIDLALALGLSGTSGPLGIKGGPSIPDNSNPLLDRGRGSSIGRDEGGQDASDGEMDFPEEMGPEAHFKIPVMTLGSLPGQSSEPTPHSIDDDWVAFFSSLINQNDSAKPRILLLESCSTMSSTFPIWWPSFAEAVRSRRRKARATPGRRSGSKPAVWDLVKPTSIVLSFAPSILGPHTANSSIEQGSKGNDEEIWWGTEEGDAKGRQQRDAKRMETLRSSNLDARQIIPSASRPSNPSPTNPILAALASRFAQTPEEEPEQSLLWHAIPIIPSVRQLELETKTRITWRQAVSVGLVARALGQLHATLANVEASGEWHSDTLSWPDAQRLATFALGRRTSVEGSSVDLKEIIAAQVAIADDSRQITDALKRLLPAAPSSAPLVDPVVSALKKATDLNKHEKRLLPCVVDAHKLASTNFARVHLPNATIDAIRTMVSLPLLFPDAFRTGILGEHSAGGALLFGPPGTGKTLLARAVASESGARMLAIQPSDVNDMYVGEGEKLVRAVFSLARRLSPCVVFIDEVDSLFGARSAKDSSGSGRSHNQLLTEFMQEMDGLNSAITNREQRVVVVGATNRPFDLDEAVLRRLPRRLLIDLPRHEDRKAILSILLKDEALSPDVNLERLSSLTDGYSGSDLKHLCVAAALAALKDTVQLPWLTKDKASTEINLAYVPQPPLPGAIAAQAIDKDTSEEKPMKQAVEARRWTAGRLNVSHVNSRSNKIAAFHSGPHTNPKEDEISKETIADTTLPSRVLQWKHFETALSEISPSSTEDGTLPELRKWAEQFGDGGSKRAPRKGFGKSFGFSNVGKTASGGYGRVKTE